MKMSADRPFPFCGRQAATGAVCPSRKRGAQSIAQGTPPVVEKTRPGGRFAISVPRTTGSVKLPREHRRMQAR